MYPFTKNYLKIYARNGEYTGLHSWNSQAEKKKSHSLSRRFAIKGLQIGMHSGNSVTQQVFRITLLGAGDMAVNHRHDFKITISQGVAWGPSLQPAPTATLTTILLIVHDYFNTEKTKLQALYTFLPFKEIAAPILPYIKIQKPSLEFRVQWG